MNLIAVIDRAHGIGYKNDLLYDIPDDLQYFKEKTLGKVVVMGYPTLLSLPNSKPLPKRTNIVMSLEPFEVDGVTVCRSLEAIKEAAERGERAVAACYSLDELWEMLKGCDTDDVFVVGGGVIYNLLIDYCDYCYITEVDAETPADTFLHKVYDATVWEKIEEGEERVCGGIRYRFCVYKKK